MAEWSNAPVLKTDEGESPPRVRIPVPPPHIPVKWLILLYFNISKISTHNVTHNETSDQNRVNQGLLYPIVTVQLQVAREGPLSQGPASRTTGL